MVVRALVGGLVVNGPSAAPVIRTPDQRLRIFVSSTLRELEPERVAARRAIERLHLAPVMFELGARPHPPRELYRAYLAQSDVFVGVYWQQYGWIAPGEDISGLEDEYRLAPQEMPKLIYVKQPAERDERLAALMARIRDDDTASYTPFATADELAERIEADLATLLAERFDASRAPGADDAPNVAALPMPSTGVIGREAEVATLLGGSPRRTVAGSSPSWVRVGSARPAWPSRSRASRAIAFDRVTFVALEHVREDRDVLPAIARGFGVRDLGDRPLIDRLAVARAGRRDLIVLDNFEQVACVRPAGRDAADRTARREGAGDESVPAPAARGARVRRRPVGPAVGSGGRGIRRDHGRSRGPPVPRPRESGGSSLRASPRTTPRMSHASAGRSTACRWRSSSRRSASAC